MISSGNEIRQQRLGDWHVKMIGGAQNSFEGPFLGMEKLESERFMEGVWRNDSIDTPDLVLIL